MIGMASACGENRDPSARKEAHRSRSAWIVPRPRQAQPGASPARDPATGEEGENV
jgi:hypothetical protein